MDTFTTYIMDRLLNGILKSQNQNSAKIVPHKIFTVSWFNCIQPMLSGCSQACMNKVSSLSGMHWTETMHLGLMLVRLSDYLHFLSLTPDVGLTAD